MARIIKSGIHPHGVVDKEMRRLQKLRISDEIDDTIILVEHPEIITIGPRARKEGTPIPEGYKHTSVDRGGGVTWHGPGQIVCYPIIKWSLNGEENVAKIIGKIEHWIIEALSTLGIKANRDERMQGVWVGDNKVASIGLSFLHWTSRHGFTINYATPEGRVELVSGCGLGSEITTSLDKVGHNLNQEDLHNALISSVGTIDREISEIVEFTEPPWD